MISNFQGAHDFSVNNLKIDVTNISSSSAIDPLKGEFLSSQPIVHQKCNRDEEDRKSVVQY
jgi:hypothetical protein